MPVQATYLKQYSESVADAWCIFVSLFPPIQSTIQLHIPHNKVFEEFGINVYGV